MKLRSIDNPYTTATQFVIISHMSLFIGSLSYGSNSKTIQDPYEYGMLDVE